MPLHERVDGRRQCARLRLVQPDRADILQAAEHELFFLFPLRLVSPDGHDDRHQHRQHGHHHEERRHRVAAVSVTAGSRLTP